MLKTFTIQTKKEELHKITGEVEKIVRETGVQEGYCLVYCPHTTGAITINENTDPHVEEDILLGLGNIVEENPDFKHAEGNSTAHIKSSLLGASEVLFIDQGRLVLGTWQGIYFCEFDGPRTRRVYVKVIQG